MALWCGANYLQALLDPIKNPYLGPPSWLHPVTCGGGVQEGKMLLAQLLAGFQSLPPLPTSKLVLSGADSWVGGFVYVPGPCGSLQQTLL